MKRTISIKLKVSDESNQALLDLQSTFSKSCNLVAEIADREKVSNRVKLHHLCYATLRNSLPALGSQMACNAIGKVSHALSAMKRKIKVSFKESASVHFDKRTYSLKGNILSLFTLKGRVRFVLDLSPFHLKYMEKGAIKEAELVRKGKLWFFNLVLDLPTKALRMNGTIVAVDFGENNLAAISTGKLLGGGALKLQRDKFLAHRSRLQCNGSQSAKQRLRKISGREQRHVRHVNHCVAKKIVEEAITNGCKTIALEDLKNIRERIKGGKKMRSRLHRWSFDELRRFVFYKAENEGIRVVYMNPAYTSQLCSCCQTLGHRNKHRFFCFNCGSLQHSDLNASRNLLGLALSADKATGDVNRRHVAA